MNKKVILIFLTIIAFFAGQIFLEGALSAANAGPKTFAEFLVPVFSLVAGGFLGYFFKKYEDIPLMEESNELLEEAKTEILNLKKEISSIKKVQPSKLTKASKKTTKVS